MGACWNSSTQNSRYELCSSWLARQQTVSHRSMHALYVISLSAQYTHSLSGVCACVCGTLSTEQASAKHTACTHSHTDDRICRMVQSRNNIWCIRQIHAISLYTHNKCIRLPAAIATATTYSLGWFTYAITANTENTESTGPDKRVLHTYSTFHTVAPEYSSNSLAPASDISTNCVCSI